MITAPDSKNLVLFGGSDRGTEFAAYEFLERFVGVRWLMPSGGDPGSDLDGDDDVDGFGTDVPVQREIFINAAALPVRSAPAMDMRSLSPIFGTQNLWQRIANRWAHRNRLNEPLAFTHGMSYLFPPPVLCRNDSDCGRFYVGHKVPTGTDWQPNFKNPQLVSVAAARIADIASLPANAQRRNFTLGVNDSKNFDSSNFATDSAGRPLKNWLGLPDASETYYAWVKGMGQHFPQYTFGLIAYNNVSEPPSFRLPTNTIVFHPYDGMQRLDPEQERADLARMKAWFEKASTVGWYDYLYGSTYFIPRIYNHKIAENLAWAKDHGIRHYYGELYPNWGEGPKPYVIARLLWDPTLNVERVLDDWYEHAVGAHAAPFLKAYFDLWEQIWTKRIARTAWFKDRGQYLNFADPTYLGEVTQDDLAKAESFLDQMYELADANGHRKSRADFFRKTFAFYKLSVLAYREKMHAAATSSGTEAEALAVLDGLADNNYAEQRLATFVQMQRDPNPLTKFSTDIFGGPLQWSVSDTTPIWRLYAWLSSESVRRKVQGLASARRGRVSQLAELVLQLHAAQPHASLMAANNFDFERGLPPAQWNAYVRPGGKVRIVTAGAQFARSGSKSVLISGIDDGKNDGGSGGLVRVFPYVAGQYFALGYVRFSNSSGNPSFTLSIQALGSNGQPIFIADSLPVFRNSGPRDEWIPVVVPFTIPKGVEITAPLNLRLSAMATVRPNEVVYVDDVGLFKTDGKVSHSR